MYKLTDKIPEKGIDIIGYDNKGDEYYCFRCECSNPNCIEWRDSLMGAGLMVEIVEWEYKPKLNSNERND